MIDASELVKYALLTSRCYAEHRSSFVLSPIVVRAVQRISNVQQSAVGISAIAVVAAKAVEYL
jgi:hypothetical protein